MKKILTVLLMIFAFSISANAQTEKKELTSEGKAKSDLYDLTKAIDTDSDELLMSVYELFVRKHQTMSDAQISDTEKREFSKNIDAKLKATFSESKIAQLKAVPGLYDKLIK